MIRLSNGMNVEPRAMASAVVCLTKEPEFGVLLVRNVDRRAIKVHLFLVEDGDANISIAISYRLAAIAAAMAAKQHWKRIRVVEDESGEETVFRFSHVSHPTDSVFEPPVLCTLSQLFADHVNLTRMGMLPLMSSEEASIGKDDYEAINAHGFRQMFDAEGSPICAGCRCDMSNNKGDGMFCFRCGDELDEHLSNERH